MVSLPQASSNLERWPAVLHPDHAERCYYSERKASRLWVDGLVTRGGIPRWHRIKGCGDPVAVWCADGRIAWQHLWCRDRACYACARSRSRRIAQSLRAACESKPEASLHFVTLTRPRRKGEDAPRALREWHRAWEALRHTKTWTRVVNGGVRTIEITYSAGHKKAKHRFAGWHAHAHILLEIDDNGVREDCPACEGSRKQRDGLRCHTCCSATTMSDGQMPSALRELVTAWVAIVEGNVKAQCAVPLNRDNVGQLAKYLTKLWELPADKARELFAAVDGARIVEGFGTWRKYKRMGAVETTPHGWFSSGVKLRDIEANPDTQVEFASTMPGVRLEPLAQSGATLRVCNAASLDIGTGKISRRLHGRLARVAQRDGAAWRPVVPVATLPGRMVLDALRRDARPVWERIDERGVQHAERVAGIARGLRDNARREFKGHALDPPPLRTWEN